MNTMVYEDLTDPYFQRASISGGFLEWKDTEAEHELNTILWKAAGGDLRDFSEEWQDNFMPRIVGKGVGVSTVESAVAPQKSRSPSPPAASCHISTAAPTTADSQILESAVTSRLDAAAAATDVTLQKNNPREAWFGGQEEETLFAHGTYEEVFWADTDDVNEDESAAPSDDSNQMSTTKSSIHDALQKHFKYGFLPLEPEPSIRMQILCSLVDKAWDVLCPVLIPLLPESRKKGSGRTGRDSSGSGSSGKFTPGAPVFGSIEDSPRESEHSLNSSFNEDDFSTTASHSEIRRISMQERDDWSVDRFSLDVDIDGGLVGSARGTQAERSFVLMRPEGAGQDQNIAFGLDHAIRIRSYTAVRAANSRQARGAQINDDGFGLSGNAIVEPRHIRTRERDPSGDNTVLGGTDRRKRGPIIPHKPKFQSIYKNHEFFSVEGVGDKSASGQSSGASNTGALPIPAYSVPGSSKGRRPQTKSKKSRGKNASTSNTSAGSQKFGVTGTAAAKLSGTKRKTVSSGSKSRAPLPFSTLTTTNVNRIDTSTAMPHPTFKPALASRPVSVHGRAFDFGSLGSSSLMPSRRTQQPQQPFHKISRPKTRNTTIFKDRDRGLSLPTISGSRNTSAQQQGIIGSGVGPGANRRIMERAQTAISGHKRGAITGSSMNPW